MAAHAGAAAMGSVAAAAADNVIVAADDSVVTLDDVLVALDDTADDDLMLVIMLGVSHQLEQVRLMFLLVQLQLAYLHVILLAVGACMEEEEQSHLEPRLPSTPLGKQCAQPHTPHTVRASKRRRPNRGGLDICVTEPTAEPAKPGASAATISFAAPAEPTTSPASTADSTSHANARTVAMLRRRVSHLEQQLHASASEREEQLLCDFHDAFDAAADYSRDVCQALHVGRRLRDIADEAVSLLRGHALPRSSAYGLDALRVMTTHDNMCKKLSESNAELRRMQSAARTAWGSRSRKRSRDPDMRCM